jgi:Peptidase propeptide and YPEB domain
MKLSHILASVALAATLLAAPQAFASDKIDAALKDKVTIEMKAKGYDVRKVQMEDGMIEVYAVKDGKTYELYLDDNLQVVKSNEGNAG